MYGKQKGETPFGNLCTPKTDKQKLHFKKYQKYD